MRDITPMTWAFIIGGVIVVLVLALAGGNRYNRAKHNYDNWRATGKGMLPDYDKQNNDIDKYMR